MNNTGIIAIVVAFTVLAGAAILAVVLTKKGESSNGINITSTNKNTNTNTNTNNFGDQDDDE